MTPETLVGWVNPDWGIWFAKYKDSPNREIFNHSEIYRYKKQCPFGDYKKVRITIEEI